jgi:hypothetical protein
MKQKSKSTIQALIYFWCKNKDFLFIFQIKIQKISTLSVSVKNYKKKIKTYFSFFTNNHSTPEMVSVTAQMAKMTDLLGAVLITSPILKLATNCGSTTARLNIPM